MPALSSHAQQTQHWRPRTDLLVKDDIAGTGAPRHAVVVVELGRQSLEHGVNSLEWYARGAKEIDPSLRPAPRDDQ